MTCECFGEITEPDRAKYWKGIFEKDRIPLVHPLLEGRAITGKEEYTFYKVDLARITEAQLKEIHKRASQKFGISEEEAAQSTKDMAGIPLKSDGVSVQWCQLHTRAVALSAIGEDFGQYEDENEDWEDAPDYGPYAK